MKILFEKLKDTVPLDNWTRIFDNIDELIEFMTKHKEYLMGGLGRETQYSIKIRVIKEGIDEN